MRGKSDVVIIGGGVIGLSAAYYLSKEGVKVTVLERGRLGHGCSYANAGLIVPSYSIPMATPRRLFEGLGWITRRESPISIHFRASRQLWVWLFRYAASCTSKRAASTTKLLLSLGRKSMELFNELPGLSEECGFRTAGLLHLYRTEGGLRQAVEEAGFLQRMGINVSLLRSEEIRDLEPLARKDLAGGIYYPDEAHLVPDRFNAFLARLALEQGARLHEHSEVTALDQSHSQVQAVLANGVKHRAGTYILAAGAWSPQLIRSLGLRLPVRAARGYSLDFPAPDSILRRPLMLGEAHVVATPIGDRNRITGGFELDGLNSEMAGSRLDAIRRAPMRYLSNVGDVAHREVWSGFRPASPDGIPFIGPTNRFTNLFLATGHGTLGITLSLVTGKYLSAMISRQPLHSEFRQVSPTRMGI